MTDDSHEPPKHVVDEFEKELDDHIKHVKKHLDVKEQEHKVADATK